jgi:hypothetical protein
VNWFTLLIGATLGVLASMALAVVAEGPDPVLAVFAAPFVLGLVLLRRSRRPGVVLLGVASACLAVFMAPPTLHTMPDEGLTFVTVWLSMVSSLTAVVAAVQMLRQQTSQSPSRADA